MEPIAAETVGVLGEGVCGADLGPHDSVARSARRGRRGRAPDGVLLRRAPFGVNGVDIGDDQEGVGAEVGGRSALARSLSRSLHPDELTTGGLERRIT